MSLDKNLKIFARGMTSTRFQFQQWDNIVKKRKNSFQANRAHRFILFERVDQPVLPQNFI